MTYEPLGDKILVRDVIEKKMSQSGLILDAMRTPLKKVKIEAVSADSDTKLKVGDICLSEYGGVEMEEKGLWLCNEKLLSCKIS